MTDKTCKTCKYSECCKTWVNFTHPDGMKDGGYKYTIECTFTPPATITTDYNFHIEVPEDHTCSLWSKKDADEE